jgi:hypothetical protein
MTEIKGKISVRGSIGLTCCHYLPNIHIGEIPLYSFVKNLTSLTVPLDDNEYDTKEPIHQWEIEYCTSPEPFTERDFDSCVAEITASMLYSEAVTGCYSTWTCGSGDYDFVLDDKDGHSLLKELASFDGEYVWISFGETRVVQHQI